MIEQSKRPFESPGRKDLEDFQRRALRQRHRRRQATSNWLNWWQSALSANRSPLAVFSAIPARFLIHAVVIIMLPVALLLSTVRTGPLALPDLDQAPVVSQQEHHDFTAPVAPLSVDTSAQQIGDAPLKDEGEIPIPLSLVSRNEALAPVVVQATISAEIAFLRGGPGTEYDQVGKLKANDLIQVVGRNGDWYLARVDSASKPVWISGELINIPEAAIYTLFDVQDKDIPPPPPPKVGLVRETGLLVRDGPGTNYVSMTSLPMDTSVELIERYQDWYHIGVPGGVDGWVRGDYLNIAQGVIDRVLVADSIPDPNPSMTTTIADGPVNLRKGPDSRYSKVGTAQKGDEITLIGKNKDWLQVRFSDGSKAWIFSDLINATSHILRRVPKSNDFPALPVTARRMLPGAGPGLANIAASGDVASYAVQFVGSRYRWGGTTPSGFDCSGLMLYVYRQFGVSIPRTAAQQFTTSIGASVGPMENLAPGDLVFFVNTGGHRGITHVGMYIGGGRIVHAMTPAYGVQVSNLYDSYWVSHYYGGIRVRR